MSGLKGAESYAQLFLVCDFFDSTNDVNDVFFFVFFCSFQDAFPMNFFTEIRFSCLQSMHYFKKKSNEQLWKCNSGVLMTRKIDCPIKQGMGIRKADFQIYQHVPLRATLYVFYLVACLYENWSKISTGSSVCPFGSMKSRCSLPPVTSAWGSLTTHFGEE